MDTGTRAAHIKTKDSRYLKKGYCKPNITWLALVYLIKTIIDFEKRNGLKMSETMALTGRRPVGTFSGQVANNDGRRGDLVN